MKSNLKAFFFLVFAFVEFFTLSTHAVPFKGSELVISAASPYAVKAGQEVAELGGNPVDVAVTVALVMAVTNPSFAALGGGGFANVKMGPKVEILDFRERAPSAAKENYYVSKSKTASTKGGAAVGVPGMLYGFYELHKKYGKLPWSMLLDKPIALAEKGFRVTGGWVADTTEAMDQFDSNAFKTFFKANKKPYSPGEILKQPKLAKILREIRNRNVTPIYSGAGARDIIQTVAAAGGDMTFKDLVSYRPVWREPLVAQFNGHTIYLMPPPSSGGVVLKTAFALMEKLKYQDLKPQSADEYHLLSEVLSRSFRGRSLLGDPDFHANPIAELTSDSAIKSLAQSIQMGKATSLAPLNDSEILKESKQTTHLSVLDKNGHAVAMTITLNGSYGSGVVTEQFGIALNNEMDDFTTRPNEPNMYGLMQGKGNLVAPGKRPLSSMSPTLVEKDGKIIMAIGAPGGPRIISSVFQAIYRTLGQNLDLDRAIQIPRVHHQFLPDVVFYDEDARFTPETVEALAKRGHKTEASWMGLVYGTYNQDGVLNAAFDSRSEGAAGGF